MPPTTLAKISRRDLQELDTLPEASISDVKHLSSYNWIESPIPTIAVPGSPPFWSPPDVCRRLKKDSGLIYIAQNAARHPASPLEPLFRAVYLTDPAFDIRSIDIVTDRNNIRKLLAFVDPTSTRNPLETFTIAVEIAGDTAIFSRQETATHEFIGPGEFKGFGHEFEKAYTTSEIHRGTGHHRLISYRFGDLNFLVRHETDGYVREDAEASASRSQQNDVSLSSLLDSLSLSPSNDQPKPITARSTLIVKEEGHTVPLSSTLEIKTRVAHKPLAFREVASQLWVSQTPKLVRAYHTKGIFQTPVVEDVAADVRSWEKDNQKHLRILVALVHRIMSAVKEGGGAARVRYDELEDGLVLEKVEGKRMLPEDLYGKWADAEVKEPAEVGIGAEEPFVEVRKVEGGVEMSTKVLDKRGSLTTELPVF